METIPSPTAATILRFGTFELNVANGELRKRGLRIALQEQPLRILIALLERPGDIVGREELCQRLWPHGTFVDFEHSLNAAVRRLRVVLGDDADVPRFVETVHKRGYRFLALGPTRDHADFGRERFSPVAVPPVSRPRTRLAVLPFGPCDGFADGLTEEATAQLTQASPRTLGVIARTSVERAQRDGGGAAAIGRALSADYLVEGHVRRDGDRVRITAQLIESQDETHLWAKTFDRVMTDTLSLQIEVAQEIAKAVTDALSTMRRASA
jgi:TolB-like protein/DNA-binding winged helix-turn-helix (wHTH) protein